MAYIRHQDAHEHLRDKVLEGLRQQFPIEGRKQTLKLDNLEVGDRLSPDDIRAQYNAKIKGETWAAPIFGSLTLVDNATGKVVDSRRMKLADLPQITHRYTYIVDGQEYQVDNQWQLKPGVYARRRLNGELESRFNVTGRSDFDLVFHPETKQFMMEYHDSKIPLYPIMKAMGVGDSELEKTWGKGILDANKGSRRVAGALDQFARTSKRSADIPSDSALHVQQVMAESKLNPEATELTLGKRFSAVTGDALRLATEKLLKVQAGHPQDDRDSLVFKNLRSVGDYALDALQGARKDILLKVGRKINSATNVRDALKVATLSTPLKEIFTKNSAARVPSQINPAEMLSASLQTTILGTYGGIKSEQSVTDEAKLINPSHFGFIDPIATPEGSTTGISLRLASGVRKVGNEPKIPLYNLSTGKMEEVGPKEAFKSNVVLADQVRWVGDKPVPISPSVKMLGPGNEPTAGKISDAHYVMRRPTHFLNVTTNLIPFINNTNGARAGYASRHIEQAISLLHREAPLVQSATGVAGEVDTFDRLIGHNMAAHRSPIQGTVTKLKPDGIVVTDDKGGEREIQIYHNFPLNDPKSMLHSESLVKVGDKVKAGQVVADTNYARSGTLALGTNLKVGFLPYKGFNYEDGLVISEAAADKLSSQHMYKHELPLKEGTILDVKKFITQHPEVFTRDQYKHVDPDGVVRVGTKVRPGDPLIVAMRPFQLKDATGIQAIRKSISGTHTNASLKWEGDHEGEVIGVHKAGDKVLVHVKTVEPMQVGDKLSTRGAGKGIVTMILPNKEMPHTKDGKPLDVAFNPAGLPGRMNLGQVLEVAAGKIAQKTGKTYVVNNFETGTDDVLQKVQKELAHHGLTDTEEVIDPISKKSLGQVLVGPMHMFKLVHQVDKKIAVRPGMVLPGVTSEGLYSPTTLQPAGGGHEGGQSIGSLGTYALLAHGARANLREFQSYKSEGPDTRNPAKAWPSQHDQIWAAIQTGTPLPPPRPTFAFKKFENMLRGAGINVEKKGHDFILGPLTDKHILELSNGELKDPTRAVTSKLNKEGEPTPMPHGIFDERITGGHGGNKFSHIALAEPIPNPIFEGPIKHLTGLKKAEYESIVYGKQAVSSAGKIVAPGLGATGGAGIKLLLDRIDVDTNLRKAETELKNAPPSRVDKALKQVKYLRALQQLGAKTPSEAYILHNLPIIPPINRPLSVLQSGDIKYDDINGLYRQFGQINMQLKDPTLQVVLSDKRKENLRKDLYDGVKALMGVHIPYDAAPNKGLLHLIAGATPKTGMFQDVLASRRQDLSMRSTIVPEPAMGLDEVGIPRHAALKLFAPFVIRNLVQLGGAPRAIDAQKRIASVINGGKDALVSKALEKTLEERPVLMKRDPALHKYSVQAFKARTVEGSAIKIHPLVCGGFSADFDGDSALGEVIIVTSSELWHKECEEKHMPHTGQVLTFATVDLADFPRIEETRVVKKSGVEEYTVPAGICVPAYSNGKMELKPVSAYSVHPNCEEWVVRTRLGREITCSADHSLALLDPGTLDIVAAPPRESEGRVMPTLRSLSGKPTCTQLKGVRVDHPRARQMVDLVELDWEAGWFIGATAGDGWITHIQHKFEGVRKEKSEEQSRSLNLAYGVEGTAVAEHWEKLAKIYSCGATVSPVQLPEHEFDGSTCNSRRLTCSSTAMGLWMLPLIGKGAENKHLPDGFVTFPEEFRKGLFCGLVDTDGTVCWSKEVENKKSQFALSFTSISKRLVDDIRILGLSLGLTSCVSTYINRDKPAYIVVFSTRLIQSARWIKLDSPQKAEALNRLRQGAIVDFGYNDFVPMPEPVRQEFLAILRELGASKKKDRNKVAFRAYVTLKRGGPILTRESVDKLFDLCGMLPLSPYLEKWFGLALNTSIGWDLVAHAAPTGEHKTMYDLTVPDAWTFTMADGAVVWDTMSVYVPVSQEAIQEAHGMFPSNNLFSETSGKLMYQPTNESVVGLYKLSTIGDKTGHKFATAEDAIGALRAGKVTYDNVVHIAGKETTPGRAILASAFPEGMRPEILHNLDFRFSTKGVSKLLTAAAKEHKGDYGNIANKVKDIGYWAATGLVKSPSGKETLSIDAHTLSLKDFSADKESRDAALRDAATKISKIVATPNMSAAEKEHKSIAVWEEAGDAMRKAHVAKMERNPNNLFMMYEAGVKPKWEQYKQLALAPMLMQDSQGRVIPNPVTKTYGEGLDIAGYWTHLHGARRGAVRKVQEVQEPGYLTKLMQSSASHLMIDSHDCSAKQGVALPISDAGVHDRYLQQEVKAGALHVPAGTLLSPDVVGKIRAADKGAQVVIRSPLRCESEKGICATCAGISSDGTPHPIGTAIGIHAVHALGERAVQLTLKSFHTGGTTVAGGGMESSLDRLMQLTYLPSKIPNAATLAMKSGTVEKVEKDNTGSRVWVDGEQHFVGKDVFGHPLAAHAPGVETTFHNDRVWTPPKVGMKVEAGQVLSDPTRTTVNPHDLYAATKSVEKLQNHLTGEIYKLYKDEGVRRKHVEVMVKAMTGATRVRDPGSSTLLKGEVYPFSYVNKLNQELKNKVVHEPVIHGVEMLPHDLLTDWMAKMQPGTSRLRNTVLEAAATLGKSNIHSTHPIPGLVYGAEFGLTSAHSQKPGLGHLADVPKHHY